MYNTKFKGKLITIKENVKQAREKTPKLLLTIYTRK